MLAYRPTVDGHLTVECSIFSLGGNISCKFTFGIRASRQLQQGRSCLAKILVTVKPNPIQNHTEFFLG